MSISFILMKILLQAFQVYFKQPNTQTQYKSHDLFGPMAVVEPLWRSSRTNLYLCWKSDSNCQTKLSLLEQRTTLSDKRTTTCRNLLMSGDIYHAHQGVSTNPTWCFLERNRVVLWAQQNLTILGSRVISATLKLWHQGVSTNRKGGPNASTGGF